MLEKRIDKNHVFIKDAEVRYFKFSIRHIIIKRTGGKENQKDERKRSNQLKIYCQCIYNYYSIYCLF